MERRRSWGTIAIIRIISDDELHHDYCSGDDEICLDCEYIFKMIQTESPNKSDVGSER